MHYFPVARARIEWFICKNWRRDGGRTGSYYWATAALKITSSVDHACVLAIADFTINPARAGTQTQMDLFEPPACRDWELMATMMIKAVAKRAKRSMV